jgi:hypothetical protein
MVLKQGDKGNDVGAIQTLLAQLGYYTGPIDSSFGGGTRNAVIAFQQRHLVDGIVDDVTLDAISKAAASQSDKGKHVLLTVPHSMSDVIASFGEIKYKDAAAGSIVIANNWAADNIVSAMLPVVGQQQVHKKLVPVFTAVFQAIADKGMDGVIKQFGCWCPRHKMHDPKRELSIHSWAAAVDINWATNPVGAVGDMDQSIVAVFEQYGFEWGGRWKHRDDMHFQYATGC